ncbi:YeiH family protein [Nocardia gamkensis]|uniref:YeiH family protein n=1 Tax=Nocardia gamkensis TaxID=352869 RepID=UPI0007C734D1|nr:putative sulfate exporter family transporter [Nocardia gamkensis]
MMSVGIAVYQASAAAATIGQVNTLHRFVPGLALAAFLATLSTVAGRLVPAVGAPVTALTAGILIGALARDGGTDTGRFAPGLALTRDRVLACAVVLLGLDLPVDAVLTVGRDTAVVLLGTLLAGAVAAVLVGRLLALHRESEILIAAGTTICGASAIAAVTAVIAPARDRVAYALGTIFVFNIVAVLVYPPLGRMLGLSQQAFGLWAGTAINDTSSVLAAGVAFGPVAASFAVIVKLARSLMIVPLCIGLHFTERRVPRRDAAGTAPMWRTIPLFVVLFLAASVIAGTGVLPVRWTVASTAVSGWLVAAVLAAVGASLNWRRMRATGPRPLLYGGILGLVLAVSALLLLAATGWT